MISPSALSSRKAIKPRLRQRFGSQPALAPEDAADAGHFAGTNVAVDHFDDPRQSRRVRRVTARQLGPPSPQGSVPPPPPRPPHPHPIPLSDLPPPPPH